MNLEIKPSYNILTQLENIKPVSENIPTLCVGELYVPDEVIRVILNKVNTYIAAKSCCSVSLKMHQLAVTILLPKLLIFQNFGFSPLSWNKHCTKTPLLETEIDEAFQALPDISGKLKSLSPVWKVKTRAETEVLFYIPKHILGKPYRDISRDTGEFVTIRDLETPNIVNLYSSFRSNIKHQEIINKSKSLTSESGWVLMAKEVLPESLTEEDHGNIPYETQVSQVLVLNPPSETLFEVAKLSEVLIGLYAEFYMTGNRLLENTVTYCEEKLDPNLEKRLNIGYFQKSKREDRSDLGPAISSHVSIFDKCGIFYVERLNKKTS